MKNELVHSLGEKIYCDSICIAEELKKKHKNVLSKIDELIKDLTISVADNQATEIKNQLLFIEKQRSYQGQGFRYFDMNEPAFSLLIMGFTGKKVLRVKLRFNDAFYEMRRILSSQKNVEWLETRERGKYIRLNLTDETQVFIDYAKKQGASVKGADMYYSNVTKMEYRALGWIVGNQKVPNNFRNKLDASGLDNLLAAENVARKAFMVGMEDGLPYKEIFKLAKNNVEQMVDIMVIESSSAEIISTNPKQIAMF